VGYLTGDTEESRSYGGTHGNGKENKEYRLGAFEERIFEDTEEHRGLSPAKGQPVEIYHILRMTGKGSFKSGWNQHTWFSLFPGR
jgi:hypothetical protein